MLMDKNSQRKINLRANLFAIKLLTLYLAVTSILPSAF